MDIFTSGLLASDHPFTIFSPDEVSESILSIYHMLKHAVKNQCSDIVITQNGEEYLRDGHLLLKHDYEGGYSAIVSKQRRDAAAFVFERDGMLKNFAEGYSHIDGSFLIRIIIDSNRLSDP